MWSSRPHFNICPSKNFVGGHVHDSAICIADALFNEVDVESARLLHGLFPLLPGGHFRSLRTCCKAATSCNVHVHVYMHKNTCMYIDRALFTCTVLHFLRVISYMWFIISIKFQYALKHHISDNLRSGLIWAKHAGQLCPH